MWRKPGFSDVSFDPWPPDPLNRRTVCWCGFRFSSFVNFEAAAEMKSDGGRSFNNAAVLRAGRSQACKSEARLTVSELKATVFSPLFTITMVTDAEHAWLEVCLKVPHLDSLAVFVLKAFLYETCWAGTYRLRWMKQVGAAAYVAMVMYLCGYPFRFTWRSR